MKKLIYLLFLTSPLCAFDYNTGTDVITVSSGTTQPQRGVAFCDLDYNTTFYRVSVSTVDVAGSHAALVYSRFSPLSYDGKYLLLQDPQGWDDALLYNATSYEFIKRLPTKTTIDGVADQNFVTMESAECRWRRDGVNPHQFFFVGNYNVMDGMKLYSYDVDKDTATTVHDFGVNFPTADHIMNDVEGDASRDSRYWTFMVKAPYNGSSFPTQAFITYDRVNDVILGTMTVTEYQAAGGTYSYLPTPNMVDMSPSGDKMVMLMPRCWADERPNDIGTVFDGPHAWDLDFTNPIKVAADQAHSGWGYDPEGNEMWISQNNRTDYIQATNILTGASFYMLHSPDFDPSYDDGFHFARMPSSDVLKGWMCMTVYDDTTQTVDYLDNETVFVQVVDMNIQTPVVWRIGHLWNHAVDYYSEGITALDDNGTDLWWNANWFGNNLEAYHMKLPDNWWTDLETSSGTDYPEDEIVPPAYPMFIFSMETDESPLQDLTSNNLDGTLQGIDHPNYFGTGNSSATYSSGFYDFNGTSDYVYVSSAIALSAMDISIVFWYRQDADTAYNRMVYLDDEFAIVDGESSGGGNRPAFTQAGSSKYCTDYRYETGVWQHIAVIFDADGIAGMEFVVNGTSRTLADTADWTYTGKTDDRVYIGSKEDTNFTDGDFDEFAIFKRKLTQDEILDIMNNGLVSKYENAPTVQGKKILIHR